MNRKLTDQQIGQTVEALRCAGEKITGRALRAALRERYGAAGKTARLAAACRDLRAPPPDASLVTELMQQLQNAKLNSATAIEERDRALARAERAEARETAHQDRWAAEIHSLRESVEQLKGERLRRQTLDDQAVRLQRELQVLHRRLAHYEEPSGN
jgi:chromosome segregation ATPase